MNHSMFRYEIGDECVVFRGAVTRVPWCVLGNSLNLFPPSHVIFLGFPLQNDRTYISTTYIGSPCYKIT